MNSKSKILFGALAVAFLFSSSVLCFDLSENLGGADNLNWKIDDENKSATTSFRDIDVVSYSRYTAPDGKGTFSNLPNLEAVELPSTFEEICDHAFAGCFNLKTISINSPSHLRIIGNYAFAGTGFEHFTVPDTVRHIGEYAFAYCDNLKSVDIPSYAYVASSAFKNCPLSPVIRFY